LGSAHALRHPRCRSAAARGGGPSGEGPDQLRAGVVRLVHAPTRRAARQPLVRGAQSRQLERPVDQSHSPSCKKALASITDSVILVDIMTGAELKNARREAGWTQERLAKRLGVSQAYLSLMEAGKRHVPDRVKRHATAVFGLSPTHLPLSS